MNGLDSWLGFVVHLVVTSFRSTGRSCCILFFGRGFAKEGANVHGHVGDGDVGGRTLALLKTLLP